MFLVTRVTFTSATSSSSISPQIKIGHPRGQLCLPTFYLGQDASCAKYLPHTFVKFAANAFKLKSGRREVRARVTLLFVASRTVVHLDGRCSWNIYPLDSRVSTRCSTNPVTLFLLQKISKRVRLSFHSWNEIFQFRWRNLFDRRNNINKTRFISIRFRIEKCRGYISLSLSRVSIFRSKFVQIFFFSRFWLTNITTLDNEIRFLSRKGDISFTKNSFD